LEATEEILDESRLWERVQEISPEGRRPARRAAGGGGAGVGGLVLRRLGVLGTARGEESRAAGVWN
jgi:hypothetical protein